jgi:hypothetical protein
MVPLLDPSIYPNGYIDIGKQNPLQAGTARLRLEGQQQQGNMKGRAGFKNRPEMAQEKTSRKQPRQNTTRGDPRAVSFDIGVKKVKRDALPAETLIDTSPVPARAATLRSQTAAMGIESPQKEFRI